MKSFKFLYLELSKNEFFNNIGWSLYSISILSIVGLLINIIIVNNYGASNLGNFNLLLALYILFSQISTGGIYYSTIHFSADPGIDMSSKKEILINALVSVIILSIIVIIVLFCLRDLLQKIFNQSNIQKGVLVILPGLLFFSINKVILSFLNGINLIKSYSVLQSIRYFLILSTLIFFIKINMNAFYLIAIFSISEIILFILMTAYLWHLEYLSDIRVNREWIKKHLKFGTKALSSGIFQDITTRIDILLLGYFLTSYYLGIYSIPALMAEGFYQIPIAFMVVINPLLSIHLKKKDIDGIQQLFKKTTKLLLFSMSLLSIIVIAIYPILMKLFVNNIDWVQGWIVLIILVLSISLCSPFYAFQMILNQSGKPEYYSLLMLIYITTNVFLNIMLIRNYQVIGAAIATGLANLIFIIYVLVFIKKILKISLVKTHILIFKT